MTTTQLVLLIAVVVVLVLCGVGAWLYARRAALRQRFGPEYDRVLAEQESRTAAEAELRERERRHAELELRELTDDERARFTARWRSVQQRFVDEPAAAVAEADDLITELVAARGYPTGDYDEQLAQLSVDHAETLESYRHAHEISARGRDGQADTEDLRVAVVHFRKLAAQLLGEEPVAPLTDEQSPRTDAARQPKEVHA
ncbi:hypothetical protein QEZ54_02500 [Catellatospora sp. KI3]|uniref:hypothetical protein n=1 Tax=Catellatospora sp. KI3 TaxID=3041620 RepID=UPI0024821E72|nr:hypothetical protein [Catellatospora sp. KI3]MDI1459828.1 hypothetical protein [Catellatospora sp. KI3]